MKLLDKGSIELVDYSGSDKRIVDAARVSIAQGKGTKKDTELIEYLIDNKHTSPFEHVVFTFLVKCPVFVARQWMRHRTWSYNEVSRRYTSEDIEFHVPSKLRRQDAVNKQSSSGNLDNDADLIQRIENWNSMSLSFYNLLIDSGVAREQAREILPVNLYTSFYGTVDLHNLFHFLELRHHPHAQEEIRVYAQAIEEIIKPVVPIAYDAWKEKENRQKKQVI